MIWLNTKQSLKLSLCLFFGHLFAFSVDAQSLPALSCESLLQANTPLSTTIEARVQAALSAISELERQALALNQAVPEGEISKIFEGSHHINTRIRSFIESASEINISIFSGDSEGHSSAYGNVLEQTQTAVEYFQRLFRIRNRDSSVADRLKDKLYFIKNRTSANKLKTDSQSILDITLPYAVHNLKTQLNQLAGLRIVQDESSPSLLQEIQFLDKLHQELTRILETRTEGNSSSLANFRVEVLREVTATREAAKMLYVALKRTELTLDTNIENFRRAIRLSEMPYQFARALAAGTETSRQAYILAEQSAILFTVFEELDMRFSADDEESTLLEFVRVQAENLNVSDLVYIVRRLQTPAGRKEAINTYWNLRYLTLGDFDRSHLVHFALSY